MSPETTDIIVIGGGNIGAAVAYGLARRGLAVTVLDEGDRALRSARGNFGLVWFQGKGLGMQPYVEWCLEATRRWPDFAAELETQTGVNICYQKPGGLDLCADEAQYAARRQELADLRRQSGNDRYDCELIDRRALQALIPRLTLGAKVYGASFSPHDGHVNPLLLLRALQAAFKMAGGRYFPGHKVSAIRRDGHSFRVDAGPKRFAAAKIVIAAGLGIPPLAEMLAMRVPVVPERGQILVTERVRPALPFPLGGLRQTAEGSFMIGASNELVGYDTSVTTPTIRAIAARTLDAFPGLSALRVVRSWAALRPLTPDHFPIYHESETHPGAFVITSHSGVSLASVNATYTARWLAGGEPADCFSAFDLRRFNVSQDS